ncbi:MAG: hypothetical protein KF866_01955 [Phycisphaeraceae bacterium]|nr:hypothetical protein [Phycisphaeraceae bacterium]
MKHKNAVIIAGVAIAAAGVAIVALVRSGKLSAGKSIPVQKMSRAELASHTQVVLKPFPVTRFDATGALAEVREKMQQYAVLQPTSPGMARSSFPAGEVERQLPIVLELAADLVYHRFGQDDVHVYKAFRRSQGYELKPTDSLVNKWMIASDYQDMFHRPYPGNEHFERVFDEVWDFQKSFAGSRHMMAGLCLTPDTVVVSFYDKHYENPNTDGRIDGTLGPRVWVGGASGSLRHWWTPGAEDLHAALRRRKVVRMATVGVVAVFNDGKRLPILVRMYLAPESGNWRYAGLHYQNDYDDHRASIGIDW